MGYRVHKVNDDQFKVVEVFEGEVRDIKTEKYEANAKTLQRHLNYGGGFDGWTPAFFTNRIEVNFNT